MEPGAKKDTKKLVYGLAAFVFVVGGVVLFVNGTQAVVAAACVFLGLILIWLALRAD